MLHSLSSIIQREVSKIQEELGLYADETLVWKTPEGVSNSAGNIALHVAGNLQYFIGATLGKTGYVRNRTQEFEVKNVPLDQVISELEKAKLAVDTTFLNLDEFEVQKLFPMDVFGGDKSTEWFLIHLLSHTSYHLGQINYHRRLLGSL